MQAIMTTSRQRTPERRLRMPLGIAALVLVAGLGVLVYTRLVDDGSIGAQGCELVPLDFNGQVAGRRLGSTEPCERVDVALRPVGDTNELTTIDWPNDIKVCEKHPSATAIEVAVITSAGREIVVDSFFRGEVAPGAAPITSMDIVVPDGYSAVGEIQPIAVCRTSDAEMIMTFRSAT